MVCAERLVHFALQTLFTAGIVIAMLTRATRVLSVERKFENTFNVKSQVLPQWKIMHSLMIGYFFCLFAKPKRMKCISLSNIYLAARDYREAKFQNHPAL